MFTSIFVFLLVVLIYIYIVHQWKYSENLDVFELDQIDDPAHLQEACDLRQPLVFSLPLPPPPPLQTLSIKDAREYSLASPTLDAVEMTAERAHRFLAKAPPHYFSDGNVVRHTIDDSCLRPSYTVWSSLDVWLGAAGAKTPWRHHTKYRQFLCPSAASVSVRFLPWSALVAKRDYEFYEFYSVSPSAIEPVHVVVHPGQVLYVPPYWWYCVEYSNTPAKITVFSYMTVMNAVANAAHLVRFWLQQQNIHHHTLKKKVLIDDGEGGLCDPVDDKHVASG